MLCGAMKRSIMKELIERVWVYGRDGARHQVEIHQHRTAISGLDGPASITESATARLKADGVKLNYIDENTFRNPVTGQLLYRHKITTGELASLAEV
jgi:hypothetical protein